MGRPASWVAANITSEELTLWHAYEAVCGPIGLERGDYLTAQMLALWASTEKDPVKVEDVLIKWDAEADEVDDGALAFKFAMLNGMPGMEQA
jgi:hypothetical protein